MIVSNLNAERNHGTPSGVRVDPEVIAALDEIAASMRPTPTRAQLIDVAVAEYVERHGKAARRKNET
ncbi:MAG TPA: ribbon-helix-helix protein, CopG family [Tepidisphaeraceae bacterium]|nr:ribbon-helix-helix protein, CopG family [Tepidisphaeraceae bacterium]